VPVDFSNALLIGIASRALFDLEHENRIFENEKLPAFITYQRAHEEDILQPGTAFSLVRSLLSLNGESGPPKVEVVVMSRNHPDVHLRVSHSIKCHGLKITRAMLTGGEPVGPYLAAYKFDLFLSASHEDVSAALARGIAAARIYTPPANVPPPSDQIRIAFDGDCVLFGPEAEYINQHDGLQAFFRNEQENARIPLPDGPFANFVRKIAAMQGRDDKNSPFRLGLVTARNAPAHERAIRTLRSWGVRIDGCAFLGGMDKGPWLEVFQPQIFFDDQESNCRPASALVPTAQVPFSFVEPPAAVQVLEGSFKGTPGRQDRYLLVCRGYLGRAAIDNSDRLASWYDQRLAPFPPQKADAFLTELSDSIKGTPAGKQRPGKGEQQAAVDRFFSFLDALALKHQNA
jgi:5'-nucleotidase